MDHGRAEVMRARHHVDEHIGALWIVRRLLDDTDAFVDPSTWEVPELFQFLVSAGGLERDEALAVLRDARFSEEVRLAEQSWTSKGIQGVPAMIFNQKYLVTGAQGTENFASILRQLTEEVAV